MIQAEKIPDTKNSHAMPQSLSAFSASSGRMKRRVWLNHFARVLFFLVTASALVILSILIFTIIRDSIGWLDWKFITGNLSIFPEKAGIKGPIIGSLMLMAVVIPVTVLLGVATAIYLEEFAGKNRLQSIIQTNISNLAGVPSVIFGLLGLAVFSRLLGLGSSILAGGLTMSLLVLPIVVVSAQEAIRSVPGYIREASYALGATRWTTIRRVVLPAALPGISTGTILAISGDRRDSTAGCPGHPNLDHEDPDRLYG